MNAQQNSEITNDSIQLNDLTVCAELLGRIYNLYAEKISGAAPFWDDMNEELYVYVDALETFIESLSEGTEKMNVGHFPSKRIHQLAEWFKKALTEAKRGHITMERALERAYAAEQAMLKICLFDDGNGCGPYFFETAVQFAHETKNRINRIQRLQHGALSPRQAIQANQAISFTQFLQPASA